MKKQYCIPKDLINKNNVSIKFNDDFYNRWIDIKFSEAIAEELSKWRRSRVNDLKNDIRNAVEYWFLYEPANDSTIACIYDEVFKHLNQVY